MTSESLLGGEAVLRASLWPFIPSLFVILAEVVHVHLFEHLLHVLCVSDNVYANVQKVEKRKEVPHKAHKRLISVTRV